MSDLDAVASAQGKSPLPPPRRGPLVLGAMAVAALAVGLGLVVAQVWQWREEAREGMETLRAAIIPEAQLRTIVGQRSGPPAAVPDVARAVVDLIKLELPPLLAPIALVPAEPAGSPRADGESEIVLQQTVPFPRIGSDGDGEIERAIGALTGAWRKHMTNGACTLTVDGHTDTKGTDEANLLLSERRALFVAKILATEFSSARIATRGWGERRLLVLTPDGVDELANRRVDVTLTCPTMSVAMNSAAR